jgi:drug/metabolite transporter (DMT)-like permease
MWIYYSLYFALYSSVGLIIQKKLVQNFSPKVILFIYGLFAIPFSFGLAFLLYGIPILSFNFFILLAVSGILDTVAAISTFKALKVSPISLLGPISSFNPVFTAIFAFLFIGESTTPLKFLGIFLVVTGAYLLNLKDVKDSIFKPITKLATDRGVQLFFLANLLWAVTPIFQKRAILETYPQAPLFASAVGLFFVTLFISPLAIKQTISSINGLKRISPYFIVLGVFGATAQFAAFTAFSQANLGYVTAVFKLSVLFTIIGGWIFFKEKNIKERLLGGSVMIAGTLLLAF